MKQKRIKLKTIFKFAIKQSSLSLVNSLTVDLNGQNIVQQNNLVDVINNFQILTRETPSTEPRWCPIGFKSNIGSSFELREKYLTLGDGQTSISKTDLGALQQIIPVATYQELIESRLVL